MRAIVGCERSGVVREALRALGVDAYSADLEDAEDGSPYHFKTDVFYALQTEKWDLVIVHPECVYLSSSGLHWNKRRPERAAKTEEALSFVAQLMRWSLDHPETGFCLENPHGCISTRLPHLDSHFVKQTIQPYEFGDDASKATVLRLRNLPELVKDPKNRVPGRIVEFPRGSGKYVERWSNQTDSGQNRLGPSETRSMDRARTYPGIAGAMADQFIRHMEMNQFTQDYLAGYRDALKAAAKVAEILHCGFHSPYEYSANVVEAIKELKP